MFGGVPKPRPHRHSSRSVQSVSGITLVARPKGESRVVVSMIDRSGRLVGKMNVHTNDWKNFAKGWK